MDLDGLETLAAPLFVRHARRDDRTVIELRGIDHGETFGVEVDVFPTGGVGHDHSTLGPYCFPSFDEAVRFTEEALLALEYLGCSVHSGPAVDDDG